MSKRCSLCGKVLPDSYTDGLCGLCKIGLVPSEPLIHDSRQETDRTPDGRKLSGLFCPHCRAELSYTDLKRQSCSICDSPVTVDTAQVSAEKAQEEADSYYIGNVPSEKTWPDDAPRW